MGQALCFVLTLQCWAMSFLLCAPFCFEYGQSHAVSLLQYSFTKPADIEL